MTTTVDIDNPDDEGWLQDDELEVEPPGPEEDIELERDSEGEVGSAFTLMLRSMRRFDPVTSDAERQLARRVAAGDEEARAELLQRNRRLVISIVKRYQGHGEGPVALKCASHVCVPALLELAAQGLQTRDTKPDDTTGSRFCAEA